MRDFSFVKTDQPTMAEFNKRFGNIADFANSIGNEYVWERAKYAIVNTDVSNKQILDTTSYHFNMATNVSISGGVVSLVSPTDSGSLMASDIVTSPNFLRGKYIQQPALSNDIYYCASSATFKRSAQKLIASSGVSLVSVGADISYVNSPNPNAYPIDDGYTYTALGQLGNKVRMATGSYTGTGTYGEANKNVLKLDFEPKLVFLAGVGIGDHGYALSGQSIFNHWNNGNYAGNTQLPHGCSCEFSGNEFKYYNGSQAAYQFNISGRAYNYVAIG